MLRRWLLGTTSYGTLTRHWRSTIVRRRYEELRFLLNRSLPTPSDVRLIEEFRALERIV